MEELNPIPPFLFLGCNTPWVTALARELSEHTQVFAVASGVSSTRGKGPQILEQRTQSETFTWEEWILPSGYAGSLSFAFSPFLARRVERIAGKLEVQTGALPIVIVPYPYIFPWLNKIPHCPVIYYNLDDYLLYEPHKAKRVERLQKQLIQRSIFSICLSHFQTTRLAEETGNNHEFIHFPLGVLEEFIRPEFEESFDDNSVIYVGNMEDRVDWSLVKQVALQCPDLDFNFVGSYDPSSPPKSKWEIDRHEALSLPNTTSVGSIPQKEVAHWMWRASVNWMPYLVEHPFNLAACPTKIMDYMASGRPAVTTPTPECALHKDWMFISNSPDETSTHLNKLASAPQIHSQNNLVLAKSNTWAHRAVELLQLIQTRLIETRATIL